MLFDRKNSLLFSILCEIKKKRMNSGRSELSGSCDCRPRPPAKQPSLPATPGHTHKGLSSRADGDETSTTGPGQTRYSGIQVAKTIWSPGHARQSEGW